MFLWFDFVLLEYPLERWISGQKCPNLHDCNHFWPHSLIEISTHCSNRFIPQKQTLNLIAATNPVFSLEPTPGWRLHITYSFSKKLIQFRSFKGMNNKRTNISNYTLFHIFFCLFVFIQKHFNAHWCLIWLHLNNFFFIHNLIPQAVC